MIVEIKENCKKFFTVEDFRSGNVKVILKDGYFLDVDKIMDKNMVTHWEIWVSNISGELIELKKSIGETGALKAIKHFAEKYGK